jgi:hypothetical protein
LIDFTFLTSSFSFIYFCGCSTQTQMSVTLYDNRGRELFSKSRKIKVLPNTQVMSQIYKKELTFIEIKPALSTNCCLTRSSKLSFEYSLKINENLLNPGDHVQVTVAVRSTSNKNLEGLKIGFVRTRNIIHTPTQAKIFDSVIIPTIRGNNLFEQHYLMKLPSSNVEIIDCHMIKQYLSIGYPDGFMSSGLTSSFFLKTELPDLRNIKASFKASSPVKQYPEQYLAISMTTSK